MIYLSANNFCRRLIAIALICEIDGCRLDIRRTSVSLRILMRRILIGQGHFNAKIRKPRRRTLVVGRRTLGGFGSRGLDFRARAPLVSQSSIFRMRGDDGCARIPNGAATIAVPFYLSRLSVKRARRLVEEVGKAATRLESSFESRRATIRNLAVLRSIEDQAHEVSPAQINTPASCLESPRTSLWPAQTGLANSRRNHVILSGRRYSSC